MYLDKRCGSKRNRFQLMGNKTNISWRKQNILSTLVDVLILKIFRRKLSHYFGRLCQLNPCFPTKKLGQFNAVCVAFTFVLAHLNQFWLFPTLMLDFLFFCDSSWSESEMPM